MLNFLQILAAKTTKINAGDAGIPTVGSDSVLEGVLKTVYIAGGFTAVIIIIMAGIFYAISEGDASKIKLAKDTILYAVVGLIVIMMAFVITNFVIGNF